jgi:transposase-like protein
MKYKSMTHTQLAECAGVSRRTLYNWLRKYENHLRGLGVTPHAKLLPPKAVRFICETYSIDVD